IVVLGDETSGGQFIDKVTGDLFVEVEIEILQPLVGIAKSRLLAPALKQAVGALGEFVLHERGDEVDRCHALGAGLLQARFQPGRSPAEAQVRECTVKLDEVHWDSSCFIWAIRSRYWVRSRMSGSMCTRERCAGGRRSR